jgi:glycerol-3-phosphate dehydrogenase
MTRDLARLTDRTFDVLVAGGGIYGLAVAYDAAQRGLSVALIERDDFGSGNSFNHLRTIHGGLRHLQRLDLARARESVRERSTLARIAPHAVRPLPFVLPLTRSLTRGRMAMCVGLALDRLVGFDRNRELPETMRLPAGQVISREEAMNRFPLLRREGLTGAATWYDYITTESDRLTISVALSAEASGAALTNWVEALHPLVEGRRVVGLRARDRMSGRELEIGARVTVNATGAAADRIPESMGIHRPHPLLRAMNLVTRRPACDAALAGLTASGRYLFMVPWQGRALFGTWESERPVSPDAARIVPDEVAAFIAALNRGFEGLDLREDDVTLVHHGLVPAVATSSGRMVLAGSERVQDHAGEGIEGLLTVTGAKYTTARLVAERVVDRLMSKLGRDRTPSRTATTLLAGDLLNTGVAAMPGIDVTDQTRAHLLAAYGAHVSDVCRLIGEQPAWGARVSDQSPVIAAELVHAVRREMAVTLCDAVIRRTPLGALGHPGDPAVRRAASIVGRELGWSDDRRDTEIAAVNRFYQENRVV